MSPPRRKRPLHLRTRDAQLDSPDSPDSPPTQTEPTSTTTSLALQLEHLHFTKDLEEEEESHATRSRMLPAPGSDQAVINGAKANLGAVPNNWTLPSADTSPTNGERYAMTSKDGAQRFKLYVSQSLQKGRGLFAGEPIPCGQLLLKQNPFVYVVDDKNLSNTCSFCFSQSGGEDDNRRLFRCSGCRYLHYCSTQCQRKDWKEHKDECRSFAQLHPKKPTTAIRTVSRILRKVANDPSLVKSITSMESNRKKFESSEIEAFAQMSLLVRDCVGSSAMPGASEIIDLWCRFTCNSHAITDGELVSRGVGIYPTVALINHSCSINCVVVFEGNEAFVRSIRTIDADEELVVSYIDTIQPREIRRTELMGRYFFSCDCELCNSIEVNPRGALRCSDVSCEEAISSAGSVDNEKCPRCATQQIGKSADVKIQLDDASRQCKQLEDEANASGNTCKKRDGEQDPLRSILDLQVAHLHRANKDLLRTRKLTFEKQCRDALWNEALTTSEEILSGYEDLFPEFHPLLGIQRYIVGKVGLLAEEDKEGDVEAVKKALGQLRESLRRMRVSHGMGHALTREIELKVEGVERYLVSLVERNRHQLTSIENVK